MTKTGMISKTNHLHHILLRTNPTTNPTETQWITVVIQDILVLVLETGHLPKIETGSPRTDRVGIVGAGLEMEIKVADRAGQLTDNHMVAGLGINQDITAGHVLPPTPGVIDMRKPQLGKLHQTVSHSEEMVDHPPAQEMIHVADQGHRTVTGCAAHHVIGLCHSPTVGTAPEAAKDKCSNAEKAAIGHVPLLKDVQATLSTVAGLVIGEVLLPTQADPPAEMDQGFVHIVAEPIA